jgi:hypothetical protein
MYERDTNVMSRYHTYLECVKKEYDVLGKQSIDSSRVVYDLRFVL